MVRESFAAAWGAAAVAPPPELGGAAAAAGELAPQPMMIVKNRLLLWYGMVRPPEGSKYEMADRREKRSYLFYSHTHTI